MNGTFARIMEMVYEQNKQTFTLSGEDSDKLLEILSLDSLTYSEDVLKIETEKSYTIVATATHKHAL